MEVGIVTAQGMGDGLIMMVMAHHLQKLGHSVTTFNLHLHKFGPWFLGFNFSHHFSLQDLSHFDTLILQHDNTPFAEKIVFACKQQKIPNLYILYTNYKKNKHGPINPKYSIVFTRQKTMVENVLDALQKFFPLSSLNKENGIQIPKNLVPQKYHTRIIIHPLSSHSSRSWPSGKFIALAKKIRNIGYDPTFCVPLEKKAEWSFVEKIGFPLFASPNLSDLAEVIYESKALIGNDSGPAHLASCLNIPTIVLGKGKEHLRYWKPGWKDPIVIRPYDWIPQIKYFRIRNKYWKLWITPRRVFSHFLQLIKK